MNDSSDITTFWRNAGYEKGFANDDAFDDGRPAEFFPTLQAMAQAGATK